MAKVTNKVASSNKVAQVATVVETVTPATSASAFIGCKYIASASGTLFANVAEIAAKLASVNATQEQLVNAACTYYGINAIAWYNKHADKGGKGCLTVAKTLATAQGTTAQLHAALIAQAASNPKGGKYAPALAALAALANGGKVQSQQQAALALGAVAWCWGYLANKQVNGNKGNLAAALATIAKRNTK